MSDWRLAVRALKATPVVSLVAALSLTLGIGANTAIFSLVNGLLLRTLPLDEPQRLVTISSDAAIRMGFKAGLGWSYGMWDRLHRVPLPFDAALAWTPQRLSLASGGDSQPADSLIVSGDFFRSLGVPALIGRTLTAADDVRGGGRDGPVVVISHAFWQRRFGGSPTAIGTALLVEGVPLTIVGVTPPAFFGLEVGKTFDLALPIGVEPLIRGKKASIDSPRSFFLFVMLRLKPGQTLETANAAIRTLQADIVPPDAPPFVKAPFTLVPASIGADTPDSVRPRYERSLLTLLVVVALVLLIAAANIANLQLARATARRHELSVRVALGASRWRLARQLLAESLVLAGIGAAGGLLFASWASRALVAQLSTSVTSVALDLPLDWRVLAFTAVVTALTAVVAGTAPAFRASGVAPIDAMKANGRADSNGGRMTVASGLVVAQVALSLILIVAAGLFSRTFQRLASIPLGFEPERVLLINVDTARAHTGAADRIGLYERLAAAVASVPGTAGAAGSAATPVSVGLPRNVVVSGEPPGSDHPALVNGVTAGWFAAYGTPLRAGRDIDARDTADAPPVVIVNEAFTRRFLQGRGALGERVAGRMVIGVAGDQIVQGAFKPNGEPRSVRDEAPPSIYVPLAQSSGLFPPDRTAVTLSVRTAGRPPSRLARAAGAALTAVDPGVTFTARPLADYLDASLVQERTVAMLAKCFGGLALLLAALGLYGTTAYSVVRRRPEIGIRLALGAAPAAMMRLVLTRVAGLVGAGVVIGAAASAWLSRFIASMLYGLGPRDPATLASAALILGLVGAIAGWLPASRAAHLAPADVLREG